MSHTHTHTQGPDGAPLLKGGNSIVCDGVWFGELGSGKPEECAFPGGKSNYIRLLVAFGKESELVHAAWWVNKALAELASAEFVIMPSGVRLRGCGAIVNAADNKMLQLLQRKHMGGRECRCPHCLQKASTYGEELWSQEFAKPPRTAFDNAFAYLQDLYSVYTTQVSRREAGLSDLTLNQLECLRARLNGKHGCSNFPSYCVGNAIGLGELCFALGTECMECPMEPRDWTPSQRKQVSRSHTHTH